MRAKSKTEHYSFDKRHIANKVKVAQGAAIDTYSGYKVGAGLVVKFFKRPIASLDELSKEDHNKTYLYCGSNINLSGMEVKIHAEQLALFQLILDLEENSLRDYALLESVYVTTSEDDLALSCGHCLQTISGACKEYDWDRGSVNYIAFKGDELYTDRGNPEGIRYQYEHNTLSQLLPDTYVNK